MTPQEMSDRVEELCESWINGNRKWVATEIFETPGADAIELTLAMHEALEPDQMVILLRLIASLEEAEPSICDMGDCGDCTKCELLAEDPGDLSWVTAEMFGEKLIELAACEDLLAIPGVLELVSEALNNEVIEALQDER